MRHLVTHDAAIQAPGKPELKDGGRQSPAWDGIERWCLGHLGFLRQLGQNKWCLEGEVMVGGNGSAKERWWWWWQSSRTFQLRRGGHLGQNLGYLSGNHSCRIWSPARDGSRDGA